MIHQKGIECNANILSVKKLKSKFLLSPSVINGAASISVSLTFGPHSYAGTVNAAVGGWPSGSTGFHCHALFRSAEC